MSESDNQALVAQILSSYLSNNSVSVSDLPSVIETVKKAFTGGADPFPVTSGGSDAKKWQPVVPVKKSVSPEAITCLCCGGKFKSLKRHIGAEHEMSPSDYRAAFGLNSDYPIVAPNYAAQRSTLAKSLGLGRKVTRTPAPKKVGAKSAAAKKASA
ncbi:MAG: MucR family transcriptional regulator [Methylocystis sp.]